jgi:hypothetical protein
MSYLGWINSLKNVLLVKFKAAVKILNCPGKKRTSNSFVLKIYYETKVLHEKLKEEKSNAAWIFRLLKSQR